MISRRFLFHLKIKYFPRQKKICIYLRNIHAGHGGAMSTGIIYGFIFQTIKYKYVHVELFEGIFLVDKDVITL